MIKEPKIVLFDLETMPNLSEVAKVFPQLSDYPGRTLKASINSVICFGYKIYGEDTKIKCAWDFKTWNKNKNDDKALCKFAYEILTDADCIVTHNGKRFDWKFLQTRLMIHGLKPLPKISHIDTCHEARKNLLLFNNKLDTVSKFLDGDRKLENGGWDLWVKVLTNESSAKKLMKEYCMKDVDILDKVFKKLKPLLKLPNYNMYIVGEKMVCPNCGSTRLLSNGTRATNTQIYKRYSCRDCGTWSRVDRQGKLPRVA